MNYLSKSDFKVARECPAKLYYRKMKYPNLKQQDEYMQLLAEGGFMVGKMAQLLFPEGIEVAGGRDQERAIKETESYLEQENITLFEPAIYVNGMLIRIDVLVKRGNHLDLIEVKAKSIDGDAIETRGSAEHDLFWKRRTHDLDSKWKPYLEDVAYQYYVLRQAFPAAQINPYLMLCDKSKHTQIDNMLQQFILHADDTDPNYNTYNVEYTGDLEALRADHNLIQVPVDREVEHLQAEISEVVPVLVESVLNGAKKLAAPLCTDCKKCEYRLPLDTTEKNGFLECWGKGGETSPHLLELRNLGNVKAQGENLADGLFAKGKTSLYDIPIEWLDSPKQGLWQKRQIEYSRKGEEWFSPELKDELEQFGYPLHFIDFETSRMALPYHAGMRPYGQIAFQWSCHTIQEPGAQPQHREWINTQATFPNIEFAQTLMECLGNDGTIFMWWPHEKSVLKDIIKNIKAGDSPDPELVSWLLQMVDKLVDQYKIATNHYYHPEMKGSVSIKSVLPAIWNNNPYLHQVEYFRPYFKECDDQVISPYDTLEQIDIAKSAEVIKEGTGAMRAYQEMMYGLHCGDTETHAKWTQLLRQYCQLDTMAMVIIYYHWCYHLKISI